MEALRRSKWFKHALFIAVLISVLVVAAGVARATTDDQVLWQSDITVPFTAQQLAAPDWSSTASALESGLAARLEARDVQLATQRVARPDRGLDYKFSMSGKGGLGQFKQAVFDDAQPIGGLLGGPAVLKLTGNVAKGENLSLLLETNPSTGYIWEVDQIDQNLLSAGDSTDVVTPNNGIGVPGHETVHLHGAGEGRTTVTLRYHRPWESEQPTRVLSLSAPQLKMLLDLTNPNPVQVNPPSGPSTQSTYSTLSVTALPSSFDWRSQGKLTPVRNQGSCGSCWAFSTVGAFEADLLVQNNTSTDLSEQYLVSCNVSGWSCNGGWFAHDYHINKPGFGQTAAGAVNESAFPYTATNGSCTQNYTKSYKLGSWKYIAGVNSIPTVDALKQAIYTYGPVSAAVCTGSGWNYYKGGVFTTDERATCGSSNVNHAIVIVGWSDTDGAWIIRNSWGSYWGESGYMRMKYGISNIGYGANYVTPASSTACYSLSKTVTPSGSGTVSANVAANCNSGIGYTPGTVVTLTASPATNYSFGSWTGCDSTSGNSCTVTMNSSRSVTATFTASGSGPGAFSKSSPANGAGGQATSLLLSWAASSGATSYEYCIDASNNGTCDGTWVNTGTATSVSVSGGAKSTSYYWQVRANNLTGTTYANAGTWWTFKTGGWSKKSPFAGAYSQPTTMTLTWDAYTGAKGYYVCIDTVNNNVCDTGWTSVGTALSKTYTLKSGTAYYWEVRAWTGYSFAYANSSQWWNLVTK